MGWRLDSWPATTHILSTYPLLFTTRKLHGVVRPRERRRWKRRSAHPLRLPRI